jgi:hypothetical protein
MPVATKADWQALADIRVREAKVLLDAGELDGAYYLGGYAIECAIKACIIKRLNTSDFWPEKRFSEKCWSHNLVVLLELADLKTATGSLALQSNWFVVKDWTEEGRYDFGARTAVTVGQFYNAIADPIDGVLTWLKARW